MQPIAHKVVAVTAAALGPLIFVVRENQVPTTAVNIDSGSKMRPDHRRAFQVPAGSAPTPGAVPTGVIPRRGFPQNEITGIAFVVGHFDPGAGQHVVEVSAAESAITGHGSDVEQHVALCLIGVSTGDEAVDQVQHGLDILRGPGLKHRIQSV